MNSLKLLLVVAFAWAGSIAGARDVFITLGGGPDPTNNQVSLEKNVEFLSRTLDRCASSSVEHQILFADGDSPTPDLQYIDDAVEITPAVQWMTRLVGDEHSLQLRYRNHRSFDQDKPANKQELQSLLERFATELVEGDRVLIYVSAHGGSAQEDEEGLETLLNGNRKARDTSIYLWGDEELRASEFVDWLDRFDPQVQVVLVMVQCYSGGFAEVVFREADRNCGLTERQRCGFFSQRHDRAAAGCTPEIDEADYQEYSSFFWAALGGQSRDAQQVINADYDNSGDVSLAEAHAYAVITSDTIDVPICTSEIVLRRYSRIENVPVEEESPGVIAELFNNLLGSEPATPPPVALLSLEESVSDILALARPEQHAIIQQLSAVLEIDPASNVRTIQRLYRRGAKRLSETNRRIRRLADSEETLVDEIRESLHEANPEFSRRGYSPLVTEWTTFRADEFVALVESFEESQALVHVQDQLNELSEDVTTQEHRQAKIERLSRTLQNVLYEANLPQVAEPPIQERYQQLLELEHAVLWKPLTR